jgi:hypothetical protein
VIGKPVILSSEYSVSAGTLVPANPERLYSPNAAVLVDSLRFDFNDHGPHEVALKTGRALITEGPQVWSAFMSLIEAYGFATNATFSLGATTWRFPRPMYLPRQKQIHLAGKMAAGASLTRGFFSVHGRALPLDYRPPATVAVPYVGVFRPGSGTDVGAADTSDPQKSTTEFRNPFKTTFHITKMVGNSTAVSADDAMISNVASDPVQTSLGRNVTDIRISDANGNPVVRDWTPLIHLCQGIRNEWKINFDLAPGQMLQAYMDLRHGATVGRSTVVYPSITLVGWREVPFKEVYG